MTELWTITELRLASDAWMQGYMSGVSHERHGDRGENPYRKEYLVRTEQEGERHVGGPPPKELF